jgi:hypothetical protein
MRQVVASAANTTELRDRAQPLATMEVWVSRLLDQAAAQVKRQNQKLPPRNPWLLAPELLRNAFASLALALGFAGLARRPGSAISLLGEIDHGWWQLRRRHSGGRRRRDRRIIDQQYPEQISDGAETADQTSSHRP